MTRKQRKQARKTKLSNEEKDQLARLIVDNLPHQKITNEGRFCPS